MLLVLGGCTSSPVGAGGSSGGSEGGGSSLPDSDDASSSTSTAPGGSASTSPTASTSDDSGESESDSAADSGSGGPACGDGVLNDGEACDDGRANSDTDPDACRSDCTLPLCGDGVLDSGEGCDDGNTELEVCDYATGPCVVCDEACTQVAGAESSCGDGVVNGPETCDDGEANDDLLPDACRTSCAAAGCGDTVIDSGEECDDGAREDDDGCEGTCLFACMATEALASGADRVFATDTSCYLMHDAPSNWNQARAVCQAGSADLVVINSAAENAYVDEIGLSVDRWIGYHDTIVEGTFEWTGRGSGYEHWAASEPNDNNGQDCTYIWTDAAKWDDVSCGAPLPFTCEASRP